MVNKGDYYRVLDHGFVGLIDVMGSDESIEAAARVSYKKGTRKVSETRGLIRYLMRHRHTSPFEMSEVIFHIKCPMFVARQLFRHRTHSANEVSGRYSVIETEFYTPSREHFKAQSKDNKQGRDGEVDDGVYSTAISRWGAGREEASYTYDALLEAGVSRELARIDLPLSTYTEFFWKQDLGNLLHLMSLRCDSHAQWEIRQYANVMAGMVKQLFPLTFEAWWDYSFGARTFSRQELLRLQGHASEMSEREESEFDQKLHGPVLPDWTTAFPLDPNNLIAEENDAVVQD